MTAVLDRRVSRLIGWMLAASVVAAGGIAAGPAQADDLGSISGVVTDSAGAPASVVLVAAYKYVPATGRWFADSSAQTGADGAYALSGLPDGDYRLDFTTVYSPVSLVPQWWDGATDVTSATTVTVSGGAAITGISPTLQVGATITGVVTDDRGAPVRGVSVRASEAVYRPGGTYTAVLTDASGGFRLTGLPGAGTTSSSRRLRTAGQLSASGGMTHRQGRAQPWSPWRPVMCDRVSTQCSPPRDR